MFGRMLSMVYPDGEVLTYGYDRGGLLKNARGDRPATAHAPAEYETYLQALLYDHFGQRVYQRVGNGVVTKYAYEPDTRRLATLYTRKPGERLLQNLFYSYDLVGNVLGVKNALGEAVPSHAGDVEFTYRYDDLHRLTYAHGESRSRPSTLDTFTSVWAGTTCRAGRWTRRARWSRRWATSTTAATPSNYQPQKCGVLPGGEPVLNDYYADAKVRPETYYYHPDHSARRAG
ncbi:MULTISPECIES: hypothetical protein [unclassified Anaeromyxobacter]|uniref:hypothetical protein n=2 Tax=Anaeromyxobacter TaxID=161492 RepID=UPI001F59C36C|nr:MULTISPECIES: hypothetical protein [unclassified Anaeromyxobacter]